MAKMGRPKVEKPIDHIVTVKFREEEYQALLESMHSLATYPYRISYDWVLRCKSRIPKSSAGSFLRKGGKDGL